MQVVQNKDAKGRARLGNWLQTRKGIAYWPLDPLPEEVHIEDIAHSLAQQCRFGGHCERFYSVAEHSVLVSYMVPTQHAFAALMHDATEAYVCDLPRPLKRSIRQYEEIEACNWVAIARKFRLAVELPAEVKAADNQILWSEREQLMSECSLLWGMPDDTGERIHIAGWIPNLARSMFLNRFKELWADAA
jgi:hypothetical protein